MKKNLFTIFLLATSFAGCSKSSSSTQNNGGDTTTNIQPDTTTNNFAKGADVSWLTQMESSGYKFYNRDKKQEDCFQVMKEEGINSIRLRAWVNPADGWCNTADVVASKTRKSSRHAHYD